MSEAKSVHFIESDPVLQLFLDSVTDQAVFTLDPDGFIATWNEGCRRLKGFSADEVIGKHFRMLYLPEDQAESRPERNLAKALEQGEYHEERPRIRKGGREFFADVSIYPISEGESVVGFAKIVKDISERKRLERLHDEVLEERIREAHREVEGLCYSIAHDLRTPIRSIVMRSNLLLEDFGTSVPGGAREHLEVITQSSLHLARLIDDLLGFSRLGQGEILRQEVDVSILAARLATEMVPAWHGGESKVDIQPGVRADADRRMLETALRALLENALTFSNGPASVQIGAEKVDGAPVYFVRDKGIGFADAYAERIFEPFQRLNGFGEYGVGTGIGLAKVKRVVERHGGRVWAEGSTGNGSTFYFTLPTVLAPSSDL